LPLDTNEDVFSSISGLAAATSSCEKSYQQPTRKSPSTTQCITYHSQVLKRPRRLDILQRLLQVPQFGLHLPLGLLRVLHRLALERLDRLQLLADIVRRGLEALVVALDLVDDGLVLERRAVVVEVDGLRRVGQHLDLAAGVVVALLEGLQAAGGLAAEAEGGGDFGPVDFQGGAPLVGRRLQVRLGSGDDGGAADAWFGLTVAAIVMGVKLLRVGNLS